MALLLCNAVAQRHFLSSLHCKNRRSLSIRPAANTKLRFSTSDFCRSSGLRRLCPLKSSSINGFSIANNGHVEQFEGEQREENFELHERLRKFFEFLPSILPGGNWWSFSEDVEVKYLAKPVTLWRALGRMWQLVARDRWVIFAAFSALMVAAVSVLKLSIFSPHFWNALCDSNCITDIKFFPQHFV